MWSLDYREVTLRPYVGFMVKTHVARDPSTTLTGFRDKSLAASLDKSEPDQTLCPVRALWYYMYLKCTETFRAGRKALFLPLRKASGRLSPKHYHELVEADHSASL